MKKIGIAGIGGIGGNVAMLLVRSGVSNIKIIDYDKVELSNLNRQFYFQDQIGMLKTEAFTANLKRINPEVIIESENKVLTKENIVSVFKNCNIIIEGFDKIEFKSLLVNCYANTDKLILSASGVAGLNIDNITVKKVGKNAYIIGDFISDIKDIKLYAPKVMIVASVMANLILQELGYTENISKIAYS